MTSNDYYNPQNKRLQFETSESVARMRAHKTADTSAVSDKTKATVQQRAEQYLALKGINGWNFRDVRIRKAETIVYLTRGKQADKYCKHCCKNHDNDNTLALRMTAKTIGEFCIRKR
jgi:hypothetical protein